MSNVTSLSGGGSGRGGIHGLEVRVARLESGMDHVIRSVEDVRDRMKTLESGLTSVQVTLARIDEKMATKPFVVTAVIGTLTLFAALVVFADNIRALVAG